MMHPRLTPANDRVAHTSLIGLYDDVHFTEGSLKSVHAPVADLRRLPNGSLDCQLRYGANVLVLEEKDGWAFSQSVTDSYVGYFKATDLGPVQKPTHIVTSLGSHIYPKPSLKTVPTLQLPFMAEVSVLSEQDGHAETINGFIPLQHLSLIQSVVDDCVHTAERHLGVPYLWGGDSNWGLDCSGLVQAALASAGINAQRDTDMQEASLGKALSADAPLQRGDIIFWKGHVGLMQSQDMLIHANAHHMAVTSEDFKTVCARVVAAGDGPVTSRKRL